MTARFPLAGATTTGPLLSKGLAYMSPVPGLTHKFFPQLVEAEVRRRDLPLSHMT